MNGVSPRTSPKAQSNCQARYTWVLALATTCLMLGGLLSLPKLAAAQSWAPTPKDWRQTATLTDVFFIDADSGWACGEQGTLLRTADGGRTWNESPTPRNCRLESISFIDHQHGWACGGYETPVSHSRTGIVLHTNDGGITWHETAAEPGTWFRRIQFSSPLNGWAVGDSSPRHPSGTFRTQDGGKTWYSVSANAHASWTDAATTNLNDLLLINRRGGIARLNNTSFEPSYLIDGRLPILNAISLDASGNGWAVGERGSIYQTRNTGLSWSPATNTTQIPAIDQVEWKAVVHQGPHVWITGDPGGVLLHSHDDGATWEWTRTHLNLSTESMFFIDERRGWIVGSLGKIYRTSDGGYTWQQQRNGELRSFTLNIAASPQSIGTEAIARIGGSDGWLVTTVLPTPPETNSPRRPEDAASQWLSQIGNSQVAWWRPQHSGLETRSQSALQSADNSTARNEIDRNEWLRYLVRQIRQSQPAVVLVPSASHINSSSTINEFRDVGLEACRLAASPDAFPEHFTQFGLQPWAPQKTFSVSTRNLSGGIVIPIDQFAAPLGRILSDFAYPARIGLNGVQEQTPKSFHLQLIRSDMPQGLATKSLESGFNDPFTTTRKRRQQQSLRGTFQQLKQLANSQEMLEQLTAMDDETDPTGVTWVQQLQHYLLDLDDWSAGNFLFQLARRHEQQASPRFAARAHRMMAQRLPAHPLTDASLLWLWNHYASYEWRWQSDPDSQELTIKPFMLEQPSETQTLTQALAEARQATLEQGELDELQTLDTAPNQLGNSDVVAPLFVFDDGRDAIIAPPSRILMADLNLQQRDQYRDTLLQYIVTKRPGLAGDWRFNMTRMAQSTHSPRGMASGWQSLQQFYQHQLAGIPAQEDWLRNPLSQLENVPTHFISTTPEPIQLDGRLDEPAWHSMHDTQNFILLAPDPNSQIGPTSVKMICDNDFLYIAITCQRVKDSSYYEIPRNRERDENVSESDHVTITLDVDRDRLTGFVFKVNSHGQAWDGIQNDPSWNPQWFVAHGDRSNVWTVEAAIPWQQLGWKLSSDPSWWSIGVQRKWTDFGTSRWGLEQAPDAPDQHLLTGLLRLPQAAPQLPIDALIEAQAEEMPKHQTDLEPPRQIDWAQNVSDTDQAIEELRRSLESPLKR